MNPGIIGRITKAEQKLNPAKAPAINLFGWKQEEIEAVEAATGERFQGVNLIFDIPESDALDWTFLSPDNRPARPLEELLIEWEKRRARPHYAKK